MKRIHAGGGEQGPGESDKRCEDGTLVCWFDFKKSGNVRHICPDVIMTT